MDTLRSLHVPDLTRLGDADLQQLNGTFDQLQNETLQPLPQMADDPVRARIDDAVSEMLGLDSDWVDAVRRALAREPSVRDRTALPLHSETA